MKLRRSASASFRLAVLVAATLLSGGCSSGTSGNWLHNAVWGKPDVDPNGGIAPADQIVAWQKLQTELPSQPVEAQQAKAAELAQRYRVESDPILRGHLLRTLACCASPAAGEALVAGLNDPNRDVRIACCDAWARHGGPQAVPMLSGALRNDKSKDVKLAAARALGKLQGPEVVAALTPALDDPDPALQFRAVQSLRAVTGKDFGDDVGRWREFARGGSPEEISVAQRMKLDLF